MYNVMVVEDQAMPRQLFEAFITMSDKYTLVHSIKNADMADIYCEKSDIDLILMDVCTELNSSGLDAAERIKANYEKSNAEGAAVTDQGYLHGSCPLITVGRPLTIRTTHSACLASRTHSLPVASLPARSFQSTGITPEPTSLQMTTSFCKCRL